MNWDGIIVLFWMIAGGVELGWSVEYFAKKKYIRGGIFMVCAIGCIVAYISHRMQ